MPTSNKDILALAEEDTYYRQETLTNEYNQVGRNLD